MWSPSLCAAVVVGLPLLAYAAPIQSAGVLSDATIKQVKERLAQSASDT